MNTNSMYCADAKNCSCEMCNECCDNVNVSGCGNPMYNVFSWNSPRKCCYRPELCAIDILHYYLTKGEAAEIYVNNREFLDFLNEVKNVYETKEHVLEILQDLLDKIDSVTASCEWDDIKDKPSFATVATSGDYSDLNNKPTIPTKTSDLINDSDFVNGAELQEVLEGKQDTLVSGENIKTINNESLLGEGNIDIAGTEDKPYDSENFSGLGRIYLKLKDGSNILTQNDFNESHTVYVVSYDFDLNGQEILIPAHCVLDFQGGSVSNGRLVSNKTQLRSVANVNMDALYGTFYEGSKYLNYNQKIGEKFDVTYITGFLGNGEYLNFPNNGFQPQSMVVTDDYFLILGPPYGQAQPQDLYFVLFDKKGNYKGVARGSKGHGNDATIRGNKLYVMMCGSDYNSIHIYNLQEVITECLTNSSRRMDAGNLSPISPIETKSLYPDGGCSYSIDYDSVTDEFAVIWSRNGGLYLSICDAELNILKECNTELSSAAAHLIQDNITLQSIAYKKGVVVINAWSRRVEDSDECGMQIVATFDTVTDSYVNIQSVRCAYNRMEPEGMCKDPSDDNNYYCMCNVTTDSLITGGIIAKFSQINDLYAQSSRYEKETSLFSKSRTREVFIDNTYTNASNGCSSTPYKSFEEAYLLTLGDSSYLSYVFTPTGVEYYLPYIKIPRGQTLAISQKTSSETPVTLRGSLWAFGGNIRIYGCIINIENNNLYASNGGYILLNNTTINKVGTATKAIYCLDGSTLLFTGSVTINGFATAINAYNTTISLTYATIINCTTGLDLGVTRTYLGETSFTNCTTAIKSRNSYLSLKTTVFSNCTTCFNLDDTPIYTEFNNITITDCTNIILKDASSRSVYNLRIGANTQEVYNNAMDFFRKGTFSNTSVLLEIPVSSLTDSLGNYIPNGMYRYTGDSLASIGNGYQIAFPGSDAQSYKSYSTSGTTATRPVFDNAASYEGFLYYDKSVKKQMTWNGSYWEYQNSGNVWRSQYIASNKHRVITLSARSEEAMAFCIVEVVSKRYNRATVDRYKLVVSFAGASFLECEETDESLAFYYKANGTLAIYTSYDVSINVDVKNIQGDTSIGDEVIGAPSSSEYTEIEKPQVEPQTEG